jgi:formylglycine-generating enzyme required for sulfatase activity
VAALTVVDVRATHAVAGPGYVPGGTVTVNSTVTYAGPCVGLAWTLLLPEGWTYASGGGKEGETKPPVGTPALLEWAWTNIPASPVTFSTTLNVPSGAVGAKTLAASAIFRIAAGPLTMMVKPDPLTVSAALYHSADTGRDLQIGLVELTRVIELYNTRIGTARTGCYKIQVGSEDGFSPDSTRTASTVVTLASWHSADSNRDGKIGLLELTRVIELYNYRSGTTRTGEYRVQIGTEDGFAPAQVPPDGRVLIPGGTFTMGSVVASIAGADKSDGLTDAPAHAVTLSKFYLAQTETTYADWIAVRTWARDAARGAGVYDFGATVGEGKGDTHPVVSVSWYDAVKWCNAKSEREGLTPVYYTNDAQTLVYRTGDVNVRAAQVKWGAIGYRLPTEAEWEYAARGGLSGQRFPWGDTITHVQANYYSSTSYAYDVSATRGIHATYVTGASPFTSPVGVFAANGYGLADMVGSVWEWTWDWYGSYGSGVMTDPRGAASGSLRVSRGGSWGNEASYARSAFRNFGDPDYRFNLFGFRPARSSVP